MSEITSSLDASVLDSREFFSSSKLSNCSLKGSTICSRDLNCSSELKAENQQDQFRAERNVVKFDVVVLNVGGGLLNLEMNVLIWRHFPDPEPAHVTSSSSLLFLNFCK